ncbi:DUF6415 family natural product biosynthesis protein [Streptomyces sp. NPDC056773]|uniref:DUF6415 family natural product biosynthesis protein n=1 Tax=unclassified Streptomyces TaxID=2593676 RepID=UPI0036ACFB81
MRAAVIGAGREPKVTSAAADVAGDVETALALSEHCPTGPAAAQTRERLRHHIRLLIAPAERYAELLPVSREKDIATSAIRFAGQVARDGGRDPAAVLRLLAKSTAHLARYTDLLPAVVHPVTAPMRPTPSD